ncbi:aldo/keto reductase [Leptolyngbya sp. 7M]|uniref:aldo/keto reductase n=1 Tax=Leptolyngbya sp. 7M TaxID=2812896 RepID=UPI001B8CE44D|nr:aldo/keto reductase [Leptolyngbya sp. 7M]QYO64119.1 aldo/keto reductase [Leptolyngbya sp. 7M]
MKERALGRTGIKVSTVGLGTARLALPERERTVKDPQDDIERLKVLEEAFTLGCTHFDTADGYGFGSSEALIGQFLKNNYSSPLVVTTKIGWNFYNIFVDEQKKHYIKEKVNLDLDLALEGSTLAFDHGQNFSYDYLNFAIDKSIFRLQKKPLDIVLLHVPSVEDLRFSNWDSSMKKIRKSGKLLYYGVSVRTPIEVFAALQYGEPDILQVPLSVASSNPMQAALMIARQRGVGIIAREIFFQGLLIKHFQEEFNAKRINYPPTIAIN